MYKSELHCHSTFSDGRLTPKELVSLCNEKDIRLLSITDHDSTESITECIYWGNKFNIKVIPGIELSTIHNGESIHLLGYFTDESYKSIEFQKFLTDLKEFRIYRAKEICSRLDKYFNIKINYNNLIHNNVVARPHIAKEIINSGYDYTHDYIFEHFINENSPAYVPNKKVSTKEGIDLLKSLNAIVSLAHPVLIKRSCIKDFISLGIDGLEAIYPRNDSHHEFKLIQIAIANKLLITGGSDFHGIENDHSHGNLGQYSLTPSQITAFINRIG